MFVYETKDLERVDKAEMEFALAKYIEGLLETSRPTTKGQAA